MHDGEVMPQDTVLAHIRNEVGPETTKDPILRYHGEQTVVVKGTRDAQDRVAEALDALRGEFAAH